MLPQLQTLMDNPAFEVRFVTLSEYLEAARAVAEPRRYTMADVFHGMSLGKNGDLFRRLSRTAEQAALGAESLAALAGFFGRPYAQWDVYPTWELEEAWRELLAAQHHDNDECEGLCGHVGLRSYERSRSITGHIRARTMHLLATRVSGPAGRVVAFNPLGWTRTAMVVHPTTGQARMLEALPPMGYTVVGDFAGLPPVPTVTVDEDDTTISLRRGHLAVTVDRVSGLVVQIRDEHFPEGALSEGCPLTQLSMIRNGQVETFSQAAVAVLHDEAGGQPALSIRRTTVGGAELTVLVRLAPELDAVDISYRGDHLPRTDSRFHAALHTTLGTVLPEFELIHDHPFALSPIHAQGEYWRKYPTGDWMTSPQEYEKVHNPFTALQLLDFSGGDRGLLLLHDGSQAFWREGDTVKHVLTMYDAWDEDYFVDTIDVNVRLVPHGLLDNATRWKLAQEFVRPPYIAVGEGASGELPPAFAGLWCDADHVAVTAYYRETADAGAGLDDYAAAGIDYPYVVRLVEWNGESGPVHVAFPGTIAAAYRTNLMGERLETLAVEEIVPRLPSPIPWHAVTVNVRGYEIVTLYLDLEQGRKITRDLDSRRSVWATSHWITKES
jgi:alpha-mannosidase